MTSVTYMYTVIPMTGPAVTVMFSFPCGSQIRWQWVLWLDKDTVSISEHEREHERQRELTKNTLAMTTTHVCSSVNMQLRSMCVCAANPK